MQLNDSIPERRNLIVFCMATIIFFIGGGDACGEINLPFGGIKLTNHTNLVIVYWSILLYLILRYWSVFRTTPYDAGSSEYIDVRKNWKSALKAVFSKYSVASEAPQPDTWYLNGNVTKRSFEEALEMKGLSNEDSKSRLEYWFSKDGGESCDLLLVIKESDGNTLMIKSETVKLLSMKYLPIAALTVIFNLVTDKYLFDWVVPWLLFLFSMFITISYLAFGLYESC